jgi:hypothetical protein
VTDSELRARRRLRADGFARLRRYTVWAVAGAAGLVGFVSVLAASSVPGRASQPGGSQATAAGAQAQGTAQNSNQQPIYSAPSQSSSYFGSGGGSPWAVSGGS